MKSIIIKAFPVTEEAVLVENYIPEIPASPDILAELIVMEKYSAILAEAKRRRDKAEAQQKG